MLSLMDTPQEPRWLDAEESQAWRALAKTLERLPAALDAQLRRDAGISHFEYQVLALLSEAPGRTLRMSELALWAGSSLPRLSQVVARLEQRGWVFYKHKKPSSSAASCFVALQQVLEPQIQHVLHVKEEKRRHAAEGAPGQADPPQSEDGRSYGTICEVRT